MNIPRAWTKTTTEATRPDGERVQVAVWGWGDDEASARHTAGERLRRLLERIARGEPMPDRYGYGSRPLREEILRYVLGESGREEDPAAILTRNSYGAEVVNAARVLFLDIDVPSPALPRWLRGLFGGTSPEDAALAKLRGALQTYGRATFRVYRTASGFRVMAIDRDFDPASREVQELMQATGTDPSFSQLCLAQRSFRARLTPKPWRCGLPAPPGEFPRTDSDLRERFALWLANYQKVTARRATCRYLETIGSGTARGDARIVQELHDTATRADAALPLA